MHFRGLVDFSGGVRHWAMGMGIGRAGDTTHEGSGCFCAWFLGLELRGAREEANGFPCTYTL